MASFPSNAKTFTTKIDGAGHAIHASHFNDMQDEVIAIEDAFLNASARMNSSASTVAFLSVTGGSTFAGGLQVANSTVNSLFVSGGSTFAPAPVMPSDDAVVVFMASSIALGSSLASTLVWTAQGRITNSSMHSTTTNPSRLTPQTTGIYQISGGVTFGANSSGARAILIEDSSGIGARVGVSRASAQSGSVTQPVSITCYKRFDVLGSFVTMNIDLGPAANAPSTMSLSSGIGATWFSMVRL